MKFTQLNWMELEVALDEARNHGVEEIFRTAEVLARGAAELLEQGNRVVLRKGE